MKKIFAVMTAALLLISVFMFFASAAVIPGERQLPRLTDGADIIDDMDEQIILSLLDAESELYGMDMVIATVSSTDGKSVEEYADDFYDYNGFGIGEDASGVILLISMQPRQVHVGTCGQAIYVLDEDAIIDDIYSSLKSGAYGAVCQEFIDSVEAGINGYSQGIYDDGNYDDYNDDYYDDFYVEQYLYKKNKSSNYIGIGVISLIVGFIAASIVVSSMKKKMITVQPKNQAGDYYVKDSMVLSVSEDRFVYRNIKRVPIPKSEPHNTGGGHSGGGTHISSSGRSHGGSSRSF
ncbi:MAG: TPM domain-containing protein [Clostridia bacterium]|nr:TPM domain-containing protein [Clostridia bacterium]